MTNDQVGSGLDFESMVTFVILADYMIPTEEILKVSSRYLGCIIIYIIIIGLDFMNFSF